MVGYLDNSRRSGTFDANVEAVTTTARLRGRELAVFDAGTWGFDMWDPLYHGDMTVDHGKPIWNLGVRATKR